MLPFPMGLPDVLFLAAEGLPDALFLAGEGVETFFFRLQLLGGVFILSLCWRRDRRRGGWETKEGGDTERAQEQGGRQRECVGEESLK